MDVNKNNNLPPNWTWVKLGDVADFKNGINFGKNQKGETGVLTIDVYNMYSNSIYVDLQNLYRVNKEIREDHKLLYGDLLFVRSSVKREGVGFATAFRSFNEAVTYCGFIIRARLNSERLLPEFVTYFFRSAAQRNKIVSKAKQVTITNISQDGLSDLIIPLPPLPEQKKIVEKIEELFSGLDNGIASLKKAKAQILLYRQSVLSAAFSGRFTQEARGEKQAHLNGVQVSAKAVEPKVDFSNQLPAGWKWVKLGEVVKIVSGNTPKGLENISNKGNFPFYKVSDMNTTGNEKIMYKSNLSLTSEELEKLKIKIYPRNTTIFPKRGGAILTNKKRLLAKDSSFDLNLMGLIPSKIVNYQYLYYWVIMLDLSTIYDGSNVPQINNKNVEPLDFPLPPIEVQTKIVEEIEKRFSEADNLEKVIDESLIKAERLRQSILKRAFEGRLV